MATLKWLELRKRVDVDDPEVPITKYGSSFIFLLLKDQRENIRCFLKTATNPKSLESHFQVKENIPQLPLDVKYYYAIAQCTHRSYLYGMDLKINDLPTFVEDLPENSGIAILCSLDPQLIKMFYHELKHGQKKKIKYQRVIAKQKEDELFEEGYPTYVEYLQRRLDKKDGW